MHINYIISYFSQGSIPFDLANRSLTLELDPEDEDEDEELISTISFSKSRIDKLTDSSLCLAPEVVGLDVDV